MPCRPGAPGGTGYGQWILGQPYLRYLLWYFTGLTILSKVMAYLSTLLFGSGKMYSPADLCFLKVSKIGHEYVYEGYSWDI